MVKEIDNSMGSICLLLFIAAIILIIIYFYSSRRCVKNTGSLSPENSEKMRNKDEDEHENMENQNVASNQQSQPQLQQQQQQEQQPQGVTSQQPVQNELNVQQGQTNQAVNKPAGCFPKEQLNPEELLPQDNANVWAQANPSGEGSLKDRNFLQAGHHIGVNTVGQTLRNANMQLRSEPPNPQVKVSPWLQTTIEPDVNRKPLEIGGCA